MSKTVECAPVLGQSDQLFVFARLAVVAVCWALASIASAQGDPLSPIAKATSGETLLRLLGHPAVQKELEMTAEQVQAASEAMKARSKELTALYGDFDNLPPSERGQRLQALPEINERFSKQATSTLLPLQITRLRQVSLQMLVRSAESSAGLGSKAVADELELSEKQRDGIQATAEKYARQVKEKLEAFRQEMLQLREAAQKEAESELTNAQRTRYRELYGKPFDMSGFPPPPAGVGRGTTMK
jgi:hypothetical protein